MTSVSKILCIDKLVELVNKYKKYTSQHSKINFVDVTLSTYINFDIESNKEDPKLKVSDHVRISKYKNNFCKSLHSNFILLRKKVAKKKQIVYN